MNEHVDRGEWNERCTAHSGALTAISNRFDAYEASNAEAHNAILESNRRADAYMRNGLSTEVTTIRTTVKHLVWLVSAVFLLVAGVVVEHVARRWLPPDNPVAVLGTTWENCND